MQPIDGYMHITGVPPCMRHVTYTQRQIVCGNCTFYAPSASLAGRSILRNVWLAGRPRSL